MGAAGSTLHAVSETVLQHLLATLEKIEVHEEPFAHFYVENAFPETVYTQLLENLPDPKAYRAGRADRHTRKDGVNTKGVLPLNEPALLHLPEAQRGLWSAVADALATAELRGVVFRLLATDLSRRFRKPPGRLDEIVAYPRSSLIRNLGGYEIGVHPDASSKIVTMQFYLARDLMQLDLGTALYKRRLFRLKTLIRPRSRFEKVKQFPFRPNSGYGFAVSKTSFHGREAIPMESGIRNSILHIYYADPNKLAS